jgi:hypothetical protein
VQDVAACRRGAGVYVHVPQVVSSSSSSKMSILTPNNWLSALPSYFMLLLQVLQLAVDTLRPNIVEVTLDLIHKLIAFR